MRLLSISFLASVLFLLFIPANILAQDLPYDEGSVWEISYIRTKAPYFEDYIKNLSSGWKQVMEQSKKEGIIQDYMVLSSDPSNKNDWDLMLMIKYKNMAALDNLESKMQKIQADLFGNKEERQAGAVARNDIRELLGNRLARQLMIK